MSSKKQHLKLIAAKEAKAVKAAAAKAATAAAKAAAKADKAAAKAAAKEAKSIKLIENKQMSSKMNNETIGQTAERAICVHFGIETSISESRISKQICDKILPQLKLFDLPHVTESIGHKNTSVDFKCLDGKTLSVKTLKRDDGKICPQVIGQATLKKWDLHWSLDYNGELSKNYERFEWIKTNIHRFLNEMLKYTYCCDYLILIRDCDKEPKLEYLKKIEPNYFDKQVITYTQEEYIEKYNEKKGKYSEFSTTLKMGEQSVGEIKFHKSSRKQVKFRFYRSFLVKL